jgi:hypothetical protein
MNSSSCTQCRSSCSARLGRVPCSFTAATVSRSTAAPTLGERAATARYWNRTRGCHARRRSCDIATRSARAPGHVFLDRRQAVLGRRPIELTRNRRRSIAKVTPHKRLLGSEVGLAIGESHLCLSRYSRGARSSASSTVATRVAASRSRTRSSSISSFVFTRSASMA